MCTLYGLVGGLGMWIRRFSAMSLRIITTFVCFTVALNVSADEQLPRLEAGGEVYTNVTVTMVTTTDIFFTHAGGVGSVKLKRLDPGLQKHFGFDPEKARQAEITQVRANAEFRAEAAKPAAVRPASAAPEPGTA